MAIPLNRYLIIWVLALLLVGLCLPAAAHNGAVAIAVPVEGIKVDGDLSDWPADIVRYPLLMDEPEGKDPSKNAEDLPGTFRIGYNEQENALYFAVEVRDDSVVIDTSVSQGRGASAFNQDGLVVRFGYRDRDSDEHYWAGGITLFPPSLSHGSVVRMRWIDHTVSYEWRQDTTQLDWSGPPQDRLFSVLPSSTITTDAIEPHAPFHLHLTPDVVLEDVDLRYYDKDEVGSKSSWVSWDGDVVLGEKTVTLKALVLIEDVIGRRVNDVKASTRRDTTFQMLFTGISLALALLHLLLFAFYPKSKGNLYYALFTASIAAAIFGGFQIDRVRLIDDAMSWILFMAMLLGPSSGLCVLYSLFYPTLPKRFWVFAPALVSVGLMMFLLVPYLVSIHFDFSSREGFVGPVIVGFALLVVGAYLLEVFRVVFHAIFGKKDGAWVMGVGLITVTPFIAYFLFKFIIEGNLGGNSSGLVALLGFIIPMSIHLARNVARTSKNLEVQLVQVEELSVKNLEQERALREEAEKELQTAHEMQMALMPKEPPRIAGFEITGRCIPANHVGGDLFQYFHQHDRLSISLADVTGHAMAAAIPVVMFSGILKSQMGMGGTVEELFGKLNQALHGTLTGHTVVCLAMGQLDPSTRRLLFSNAGCPYP
ncbi:MAG: SpoIIE family protein phosphatase, partial [Deltaproteobacteria bacterium]|nr:SpoIIE family protein phosphatase [Deltaproteobacteria bacterium]